MKKLLSILLVLALLLCVGAALADDEEAEGLSFEFT